MRTPEENRKRTAERREHCRAHRLCFACLGPLDCVSQQYCLAHLVQVREYRRRWGHHRARLSDGEAQVHRVE